MSGHSLKKIKPEKVSARLRCMGDSSGDEIGNSLKAVFRVLPLCDLTAKSLPMIWVFVLVAFFASVAIADDFKTINGKEYKNVTVSRVEPDGIVLKTKSGISKVYFVELPKEVQERFHYDPQKGREYSVQQARGEEQGQAKGSKADESKEPQTEGAQDLVVTVLQVLPDGILADGFVRGPGAHVEGKAIFFLQGFSGVAENQMFQVQAYADGTYTYRDVSGASRTLEKWVFTKLIKRVPAGINR
jgi:hypothetical protein